MRAGGQISEKERGLRPISRVDQTVIYLLRRIKEIDGNLLGVWSWVIDQVKPQT